MKNNYEILADLLEYPRSDLPLPLDEGRVLLNSDSQSFVSSFALFTKGCEGLSLPERQELYTRTFDLNPICALEIGYHLFGENYKRGEFLANLRRTERPFDVGQAHQLPDYLPVLLRLLTRLDDEELRTALISECMIPALEKMLKAFGDSDSPYKLLLQAVRTTLQSEVPEVAIEAPQSKLRARLPVIQPAEQAIDSQGAASLHPGLYAAARSAGSERE
jgi:nitrate reductase delta subunit